jgi:hypothetical protein
MAFVKDLEIHVYTPDGTGWPVQAPPYLKTEGLGLPAGGHWGLHDQEIDRTLGGSKTLEENGVREGHHLRLLERSGSKRAPGPILSREERASSPENEEKSRQREVLRRCENGHFYDPAKHTTCPYCGVSEIEIEPATPRSVKIGPPVREEGVGHTRPADQPPPVVAPGRDEITRAVTPGGAEIDPVVGWLVCIHGTEKGKDYRIRSENNTIGRSRDMYICISGDDSISRERHAVITFDPQTNFFYLRPGEGRGLAYLNGKALFETAQLHAYDEILLGKTKLLFVPLCGDRFKWL